MYLDTTLLFSVVLIRAIPPKRQSDARLQCAYDAAGNRIEETLNEQSRYADYNDLNQLQNNSGDMYNYDAEGNLSQRQSQTLGNTTYRWNAENRLIALEDSDHRATRSEFHYDALGRRIGIQDFSNGISQRDDRLIYCGSRLCARQDTLSGQFTRYYHEAASRNGLGHYYHRDHLGSVRAVTGVTLATYSYDPYGRQTMLSGPADSSDFGYIGHYWHAASGLALAPYRAYDADIGRWLSRDPIGLTGGLNSYT